MAMTMSEYQRLAGRTINHNLRERELELHALHGLAGEVGEIHSLFQKVYQGHALFGGDVLKELGDLMWFVAELATAEGFDLDYVAQTNIDKLRKRYPDGFDEDRSVNRPEYQHGKERTE